MEYAYYPFKYGVLEIGYENENIVCLYRVDKVNRENKRTKDTDKAYKQIIEYTEGKRKAFDFKYKLKGTEFQKKCWNALLRIPYGETRTYKEIAISIGNPKACRAVGLSNNRNPMFIVVPCHRVIGINGKLIGYAGGLEMKKSLLELEIKNK